MFWNFFMKMTCFCLLFIAFFLRILEISQNAQILSSFAGIFVPKSYLLDGNANLILTYCISIAFSIEMTPKYCFGHFFCEKCSFGRGALMCPAPWILQILDFQPLANHQIYSTGQLISKHECVWWHTAAKLAWWKFFFRMQRFRPSFFRWLVHI